MTTALDIASRTAHLAPGDDRTISGIAIGEGDLTFGLEEEWKLWEADALAAAADTLVGAPVNVLHSDQVVGQVTKAGYIDGVGIAYEATLDDAKLAAQVAEDNLVVSVEGRHADGGTVETDQGEAMLATDITFEGLALAQVGAAPSASAEAGEQVALSPGDIRAALADDGATPEDSADGGQDSAADDGDADADDAGSAADDADGDTPADPAESGRDTDTDMSDDTDPAPDPDDTGADAGHDDIEAQLQAIKAEKADLQDQVDDLEAEVTELRAARDEVALAFAEALTTDGDVFSAEEKADRYTVSELREKYAETDATLADPDPTPDVQSGGEDEASEQTDLSEGDREELDALLSDYETLGEATPESTKQRIAELAGTDSVDEAVADHMEAH